MFVECMDYRPLERNTLRGFAKIRVVVAVKLLDKVSTLTVEFMKDGEEGAKLASRLESVEVGLDWLGTPITSCVLVESEVPLERKKANGSNNKTALDALTTALREEGETPPERNGIPPHTPCVSEEMWRAYIMAKLPQTEAKRKKEACDRAVKQLIDHQHVGRSCGFVWSTEGAELNGGDRKWA
jgi:hypothetical protein